MHIGEFAARAGVSARALRHYEQQGLLVPQRDANGYRRFGDEDLTTVARIRVMLHAGLGTATMAHYLDCLRTGLDGPELQMCPALRRELDAVQKRLDRESSRIQQTRTALSTLLQAAPHGDSERSL